MQFLHPDNMQEETSFDVVHYVLRRIRQYCKVKAIPENPHKVRMPHVETFAVGHVNPKRHKRICVQQRPGFLHRHDTLLAQPSGGCKDFSANSPDIGNFHPEIAALKV